MRQSCTLLPFNKPSSFFFHSFSPRPLTHEFNRLNKWDTFRSLQWLHHWRCFKSQSSSCAHFIARVVIIQIVVAATATQWCANAAVAGPVDPLLCHFCTNFSFFLFLFFPLSFFFFSSFSITLKSGANYFDSAPVGIFYHFNIVLCF